MYGKEIKLCIEKIPFLGENFDGIFNFENVPDEIGNRHFVILNKNMNSEIGHWVLVLRNDSDNIEVFDSLGGEKSDVKPLEKLSKNIQINGTRVQGPTSKNCGIFCLYTAFWRLSCLDQTYEAVLSDIYSYSYEDNEKRINDFFRKYC